MVQMLMIHSLTAKVILTSKGSKTIEVQLKTDKGVFLASVPSGVSRGKYEVKEVEPSKAVENIENVIAPRLKSREISNQKEVDEVLIGLDGTLNKERLGANAILPVSVACCRALAEEQKLALYRYISVKLYEARPRQGLDEVCPRPAVLMIEGGKHAGNDLDIQEFLIVPQEDSFKKSLWSAMSVFEVLRGILEKKFGKSATNLGEEGGFAPPLKKTEEVLQLIMEALKKTGVKYSIALDAAASHFFQKGKYCFEGRMLTAADLAKIYLDLLKKYPIISLEDPFAETDLPPWHSLVRGQTPHQLLVVGDDLICTNLALIKQAQAKNLCNAVIIKPNQIGTVSEVLEAVKLARSFNWKIIVSHRAEETNDDFIADLSVGVAADFVKFGGPARGERVAKYNRMLRIEEELRKLT